MNPCCCHLKTGGMIIALLQIIGGIIGFIVTGLALSVVIWAANSDVKITTGGSSGWKYNGQELPQEEINLKLKDTNLVVAYTVLSIFFVLSTVDVICGCMLLIGIKNESIVLMKVWVAVEILGLLVSTIMNIVSLTVNTGYKPYIYDAITILWSLYFIWVIVALIQETKANANEARVGPIRKI